MSDLNRDLSKDVGVCGWVHASVLNAEALKHAFTFACEAGSSIGWAAENFEADGEGFKFEGVRHLARSKKRLEACRFDGFRHFGVARYKITGKPTTVAWEMAFTRMETGGYGLYFLSYPAFLGVREETCIELAREFVRLFAQQMGAIYFMHRNRYPCTYTRGGLITNINYPTDRTREERMILTGWREGFHEPFRPWLVDIYPHNFLGPSLQNFEVFGVRLIDWLKADTQSRGVVEPFPCALENNVVVWRPPIDRIPHLREELYRGGIVFCRCERHGIHYTPITPTPAVMRADYEPRRNWDPRLTR